MAILDETLSKRQRIELLARVLAVGGSRLFERVAPRLDEDLRQAWRASMDAWSRNIAATPSGDRCLETWSRLVRQVEAILSEASNEDGKYVYQEHHWEEPYFDGSTLASDLEDIAVALLPLVRAVHGLGGVQLPFSPEEVAARLQEMPEWLAVQEYDVSLGPSSTHVVALWTWLDGPPEGFLSRMDELEDPLVPLDAAGLRDFAESLDDGSARQLYEVLSKKETTEWHQVCIALAGRFDPSGWLKAAKKHLAVNWRLGLPVLENLLKDRKLQAATRLCEQVAAAAEMGTITKQLIPRPYGPPDDLLKLLRLWEQVASLQTEVATVTAIQLQVLVLQQPADWERFVVATRSLRNPSTTQACDDLQSDWVARMTDEHDTASWVRWLLEDHLDGGRRLSEKIGGWLSRLPRKDSLYHNGLRMLTADVLKGTTICPRLNKALDNEHDEYMTARRDWLSTQDVADLRNQVLVFWKERLASMLPDPSNAHKSRYQHHAEWLGVLFELNPAAARRVLEEWRSKHKRRVNLWEAIAQLKISALAAN